MALARDIMCAPTAQGRVPAVQKLGLGTIPASFTAVICTRNRLRDHRLDVSIITPVVDAELSQPLLDLEDKGVGGTLQFAVFLNLCEELCGQAGPAFGCASEALLDRLLDVVEINRVRNFVRHVGHLLRMVGGVGIEPTRAL